LGELKPVFDDEFLCQFRTGEDARAYFGRPGVCARILRTKR
jgi:hypothetical protein